MLLAGGERINSGGLSVMWESAYKMAGVSKAGIVFERCP